MGERVLLENILASKGRLKILRILLQVKEMNISEIARRTGLSYTSTKRHLKILENSRLVDEKNYGRIRIFTVREKDEKCQAVARLFEAWPTDKSQAK